MKTRLVLHVHTSYSYDSSITADEIVEQCKKNNINCIGLTDHCNADGGLNYKKQIESKGIKVLVGEEVKTKQGEVIGLFLSHTIKCKNKNNELINLDEAIRRIREQNGLVFMPHPFDLMRLGVGKKNLDKYRKQIDAIEVFNSRTKISIFNKQAGKYTKEHNLTAFIGSDAHIAREIPNSVIEMQSFKNKTEFLENLKRSDTIFYKKRFKLIDLVRPTMNRIKKKYL